MSALRGLKNSARSLCTPPSLPLDVRERQSNDGERDGFRNKPSTSASAISTTSYGEHDEAASHQEVQQTPELPSQVNKVYRKGKKELSDISEAKLVRWLERAENKKLEDYVMTAPPVLPKAGDVILYRCQHAKDEDYKRDGYAGLQSTYNNIPANGPLLRFTFTLRKNNKRVHGFDKQAICLREKADQPNKIMLLWYYGDEKVWQPSAHGNSKDPSRISAPNTQRAKDLVRTIAENTGKTPMHVYRAALQQTAGEDEHFEARQHLVGPRNKKQCENLMANMRKQKQVHEDELVAVYLMGRTKMYGDFIREMKLLEKEVIIVAETEMLNLAKALIKEAANPAKKIPLCIGFDTTFCLTDAYISPLVMRNCFLEGDPIFACSYLIHERRTADVHRIFWNTMKTLLPLDQLPLTVPIVSDREAGLLKGMFESLGTPGVNFNHIPCTVHIKRDVKQWLKDNNASQDNITALVGEIETLLGALTEQQFEQKYSEMADTWSEPFVEYVSSKIKSDLKRASYFFTSTFPAFKDKEATSNFIESFNNILKHSTEWKELRLDSIVMNLFNVTMVYLTEFHRAYKHAGKHTPKPQFARKGPGFSLPPYAYWPEKKFLEKFKADYQPEKVNAEVQEAAVSSRTALARIACDLGYVVLNSQNLTFTVTHPYDNTKAVVEEDDGNRLLCSCEQPGLCFHKEAYLRVTKKVLEGGRTTYKLSALRKRTRQPKGRSGRKKIRKVDVNDVVPAPDSVVAQRQHDEDAASENNAVHPLQNQHVSPVRSNHASVQLSELPVLDLPEGDVDNEVEINQNNFTDGSDNDNAVSDEDGRSEHGLSSMSEDSAEEEDAGVPGASDRDTEDDDDENGLHFYSHTSFVESIKSGSSTSGTLSCSNDTPEDYRIPKVDFQVRANIYKGVIKSLGGQKVLATDTVDNACALWIKIHCLEKKVAFASTTVFQNAYEGSMDSMRKLAAWAYRSEALNADVVLSPLLLPKTQQFALGLILWRPKKIFLIMSTRAEGIDIVSVFEALLRITFASFVVAKCPVDNDNWAFNIENGVIIDDDAVSSGVLTILNAFSVCAKQLFKKQKDILSLQFIRKWIARCMSTAGCHENILLREKKPVHRLAPQQRSSYAVYLRMLPMPEVLPTSHYTHDAIKTEVKGPTYTDNKCSVESCAGIDPRSGVEGTMCCLCRCWFHVGTCITVSDNNVMFYFCKTCEPKHVKQAAVLHELE